tara:strand:- start:3687 stop:4187 length:501 start_codon:yes stop_codon:yes gene_type:complete
MEVGILLLVGVLLPLLLTGPAEVESEEKMSLAAAYARAKVAGKSDTTKRGYAKIAGKHGGYYLRIKGPQKGGYTGSIKTSEVYTLRQAKEWLWCYANGFSYDEVLREHRNRKQREYARNYRVNREREERNADIALMAAECGFHDFSTDADGYRTYYPSEGLFRPYY